MAVHLHTRQSRERTKPHFIAGSPDPPSPLPRLGHNTQVSSCRFCSRPVQHYYDLGLISKLLPRLECAILHVKPAARTHTAAPHRGSHCHQLRICLTLQFLWRQASARKLLADSAAAVWDNARGDGKTGPLFSATWAKSTAPVCKYNAAAHTSAVFALIYNAMI